MRYAWSVACQLDDQGLVRPLGTAAREVVFPCGSGGEVWLRPSARSRWPSPRHPVDAFIESKEHLGGFAVVDVADEEAARLWAGKIAVACGWPQEVRRFRVPMQLPETS